MSNKLPVVFFGSSHLVIPILDILKNHFDLQLVVTTEKKLTHAVPSFCKTNNIPFLSVSDCNDQTIYHQLATINAPVAILASFGVIVPQELIDIFPKGIVNIHPSFLPEYRGPTPIQQAILDGKKETAVSIMLLDQEIDHGPLLVQIPLEINPNDTAESLYLEAFKLGAERLVDILPAYVAGNLELREQDHSKATYTPRDLTRQTGFIDLSKLKNFSELEIRNWKLEIARKVRAYYPWPGVWTIARIKNKEVRIKLLPKNMVQLEGKKPVSYEDFIYGYEEGKEILEKLHLLP